MNFLKKTLPLILAFVSGWLAITLEYIPHQNSEATMASLTKGLIIIGAITAFMGIYGLFSLHYLKIKRRSEGWGYSTLVIAGFMIMTAFGIYNNGAFMFQPQVEAGGISWIYEYIFNPCQATMFSILAFFIASAAYRTFRAKSLEAGILLVAAIIVMFGKVPIAGLVSEHIPEVAQWLLDYPNMAVKRAIFFGVALGGISTALRIIFGIERSYLGGE
ncbi:MAG: hypothetical protein HQK50_09160 [Oligoflexia bacterium]|nr:hypothetical protein [Oligoflexia bacterium]MBF0365728.1 hypothetical protein [Oligoflexia bacterium]